LQQASRAVLKYDKVININQQWIVAALEGCMVASADTVQHYKQVTHLHNKCAAECGTNIHGATASGQHGSTLSHQRTV
jgi:hypothetical protein